MDCVLRDLHLTDAPALPALHVHAFGETHAPHDGGVPGYAGELNKIYLLREVQRRGLGTQLVLAVAERFLARGMRSMLLLGDAKSAANGFYEHLGAVRLLSASGEFHGGYGWPELAALRARFRRQVP